MWRPGRGWRRRRCISSVTIARLFTVDLLKIHNLWAPKALAAWLRFVGMSPFGPKHMGQAETQQWKKCAAYVHSPLNPAWTDCMRFGGWGGMPGSLRQDHALDLFDPHLTCPRPGPLRLGSQREGLFLQGWSRRFASCCYAGIVLRCLEVLCQFAQCIGKTQSAGVSMRVTISMKHPKLLPAGVLGLKVRSHNSATIGCVYAQSIRTAASIRTLDASSKILRYFPLRAHHL